MVSSAELLLEPAYPASFSAIVFFLKEEKSLEFVRELKKRSRFSRAEKNKHGIDAFAIEFFDENSLRLLKGKFSQMPEDKKAAVYFEQSFRKEDEEGIFSAYLQFLQKSGISDKDVWFAVKDKERELIENIRYELPVLVNERVKANGFSKISTDMSVDDENFPALYDFYRQELKRGGIPYCFFGHIAENHLHVNLMPDKKNDFEKAKSIYRGFVIEVIRRGGSISAEHGIGKLKREYFRMMLEAGGIGKMLEIKRLLDPDMLLGRGNIFEIPDPGAAN